MTNPNSSMKRPEEHAEDINQYQKYIEALQDVPEGLTREQIHSALEDRREFLTRRECTPRVFVESGVDKLLDQLVVIQKVEEDEALDQELEQFGTYYDLKTGEMIDGSS